MARFYMYQFEPLPQPPAPDPANETAFQRFAADELPNLEDDLDAAAGPVAETYAALDPAAADAAGVGLELATAAEALDGLDAEAEADNLVLEMTAAAQQDATLDGLAGEVGQAIDAGAPADPYPAPAEPPNPQPPSGPPEGTGGTGAPGTPTTPYPGQGGLHPGAPGPGQGPPA